MSNISQSNDYLSFEIDNELFGVNLSNLNQIIETPELTNIPKSSDLLEGIIYHNEVVLPIVNFQRWLKMDKESNNKMNNILVIELNVGDGKLQVGLMVDKVLEVVHFSNKEIEKAPEVGDSTTHYIRGIARYSEKFIMLIEVDNLFTESQLEAINQSKDTKAEQTLEEIASADKLINIYLTFSLGKEKLAVDANKVVEILDVPTITPVPGSDEELAGIINIRGNILPVVDTRLKFNIAISEENKEITTVMVVDVNIDGEELSVGAIVDSVSDIIEIADEDINSAVSLDLPFDPTFLKGVAKVKDHFIQLMNIDKVFELKFLENNK